MDENKKRSIQEIDEAKDITKKDISYFLGNRSDYRKWATKKELTENVVKKFTEILRQRGIRPDTEYLEGQLDVLVSELEKGNKDLDGNLYADISKLLNKHVDYVIENTENDEKNYNLRKNEGRAGEVLEEDNSKRGRRINNMQIPKIQEYIHDIFSHTMKMLEYRGIKISQRDIDELRYDILNRLKNNTSRHMEDFLNEDKEVVFQEMKGMLSNFFEYTQEELAKQAREEQEPKKEKKWWELSPEEMKNIDPAKALENAQKVAEEKSQESDLAKAFK